MLFVSTRIERDLYAIDTENVVEIIPLVEIRKHKLNETSNVGFINYRKEQIPILDLSILIAGKPSRAMFSSRIIIFLVDGISFGVLSEQITETFKLKSESQMSKNSNLMGSLFISDLIHYEDEQYYRIEVRSLLEIAFPMGVGK
jgi:chemotaxis-related protein WspB